MIVEDNTAGIDSTNKNRLAVGCASDTAYRETTNHVCLTRSRTLVEEDKDRELNEPPPQYKVLGRRIQMKKVPALLATS